MVIPQSCSAFGNTILSEVDPVWSGFLSRKQNGEYGKLPRLLQSIQLNVLEATTTGSKFSGLRPIPACQCRRNARIRSSRPRQEPYRPYKVSYNIERRRGSDITDIQCSTHWRCTWSACWRPERLRKVRRHLSSKYFCYSYQFSLQALLSVASRNVGRLKSVQRIQESMKMYLLCRSLLISNRSPAWQCRESHCI